MDLFVCCVGEGMKGLAEIWVFIVGSAHSPQVPAGFLRCADEFAHLWVYTTGVRLCEQGEFDRGYQCGY